MRDDEPHMVSVLAASAERRGERVKGRNGAPEGGWWARSRPTVPHDSAAARALTTASTEGLGPACLPDAERSANANFRKRFGSRVRNGKVPAGSTVLESSRLIHVGKIASQSGKIPCKRARGRPCQNLREMGRVHRRRVDTPRKAGGTRPPACAHHGGQEKRWLAWWAATLPELGCTMAEIRV